VKPAHEDLRQRRPVWAALSDLFLDTDTSLTRSWRVGVLAASPYSIEELQGILLDEVYPVCRSNLRSIAGEWTGFDSEWLEASILRRMQSPFHCWRSFGPGRIAVHPPLEWRHTRSEIIMHRLEWPVQNVAEP
jgi:hypothetical protein